MGGVGREISNKHNKEVNNIVWQVIIQAKVKGIRNMGWGGKGECT